MTSLWVDGRRVSARDGQTLLDACREAGVEVPSLCHVPGLPAAAACRLCLVEVRGFRRPMPACRTRPWEGMEVTTTSAALVRHRRDTLELLLAGGGHVCAFCPASGRCELQALASRHAIDHLHRGRSRTAPRVEASRPGFAHDPSRCVLCTRCVRVCALVERAGTLSVAGRAGRSHLSFDGGLPWGQAASCTDCGRCAEVCPTGAMVRKEWVQGAFGRVGGAAASTPTSTSTSTSTSTPTSTSTSTRKLRLATAWLGGCSGCHMSLLDLDERLLALGRLVDLVHSPLADAKECPPGVDVCLVEGAVSTAEHLPLLRRLRERSRLLVALGDCACTGNVTALRNGRGGAAAVEARQASGAAEGHLAGHPRVPALLAEARPLHEVVEVDLHLPGCPPPAQAIGELLEALAAGRAPHLPPPRFG